MKLLSPQQLQRVFEDIEYFRDNWFENISDVKIRNGTVTLRRLLINNVLNQAWRSVGFEKEPKLDGMDLVASIDPGKIERVVIAIAGGATIDGFQIAGLCVSRDEVGLIQQYPDDRVKAGKNPFTGKDIPIFLRHTSKSGALKTKGVVNGPTFKEFPLSQYLESAGAVVEGEIISRREIILYRAYTGDVHMRPNPKHKELVEKVKRLEERALYFSNKHPGIKQPMSLIMDKTKLRNPLLWELCSIGQSIALSQDIKKLVGK